MKVLCSDIVKFMEKLAPVKLAEEWDNVGLLVGGEGKTIHRLLICLDVTPAVVDEALEKNVDMITSHHPVIFKGLKRLNEEHSKGNILYRLIRGDIGVYSAHTNLDVTKGGVNQKLAERLGLKEIVNLKDYVCNNDGSNYSYGLGAVGKLDNTMPLEAFISFVKTALTAEHIRIIGNISKNVERVAVFCGSFDDDLSSVKSQMPDVLVTGDIKYHTAIDALSMGMCIIDAGHFNTEKIILPVLAGYISKEFPTVEVICNNVESDPYRTY